MCVCVCVWQLKWLKVKQIEGNPSAREGLSEGNGSTSFYRLLSI